MAKKITPEFGKRLKELREETGYTLDLLTEIYNAKFEGTLNKGTVSKYENGLQEPLFTTVANLSELFGVNIAFLTGKTNDRYSPLKKPSSKKSVPILYSISTESPIFVSENIEGYEHTDDGEIDYCLKAKDDSMINARIYENDIVYVDKAAEIFNGDIVVVLINGEESAIRRFYKYGNTIILKPENPTMKEIEFTSRDKSLQLLGKVKEVKFKVR